MENESQDNCEGYFESILPHLSGGQREYEPADAGRVPAGDYPACGYFFAGGAQCGSKRPLPVTIRVLQAIPPRLEHMPVGEAGSGSAGQSSQMCLRTTVPISAEVVSHFKPSWKGSEPGAGEIHTDTRALGNRAKRRTPYACIRRGVAVARDRQTELSLTVPKRLCERCGVNEIYLDIKSMKLCEPCIWELVQEQP